MVLMRRLFGLSVSFMKNALESMKVYFKTKALTLS